MEWHWGEHFREKRLKGLAVNLCNSPSVNCKKKTEQQMIFRKAQCPVHTPSRETFPCPDPVLVSFEDLKFQLQQFSTPPCSWKQQLGAWREFDTKKWFELQRMKSTFLAFGKVTLPVFRFMSRSVYGGSVSTLVSFSCRAFLCKCHCL